MKKQNLNEIYRNTLADITKDERRWAHFLDTAAYMYKYPFHDQVLIYAQRPAATACASFELWNKLGCWIKSGAKGIALFDTGHEDDKIKYVFDIADVVANTKTPPAIWQLTKRGSGDVAEMLLSDAELAHEAGDISIRKSIRRAAHALVEDGYQVYLGELKTAQAGSNFAKFPEPTQQKHVLQFLKSSVEYITLKRCGLKTDNLHFNEIVLFNTPATINIVGNAVRDLSAGLLKKIEVKIREIERSEQDARDQLRRKRRDSVSRSGESSGQLSFDQIRQDAQTVPTGKQTGDVHDNADGGQSEPTLPRDRDGGAGEERQDHGADATEEPAATDGGFSEDRPVQQSSERHSGADGDGGDRTEPDNITTEVSEPEDSSGFSFPEEEIDHLLRHGSSFEDSKYRIYARFQQDSTGSAFASFLKEEYGTGGGTRFFSDDSRGDEWHDSKGIRYARGDVKESLSWPKVAAHIKKMVDEGTYLAAEEAAFQPYYADYQAYRADFYEKDHERDIEISRIKQEAREQRRYTVSVGNRAFVYGSVHEITEVDGDTITLVDTDMPLALRSVSRGDLYEALSEVAGNQHLLDIPEQQLAPLRRIDFEDWAQQRIEETKAQEPDDGLLHFDDIDEVDLSGFSDGDPIGYDNNGVLHVYHNSRGVSYVTTEVTLIPTRDGIAIENSKTLEEISNGRVFQANVDPPQPERDMPADAVRHAQPHDVRYVINESRDELSTHISLHNNPVSEGELVYGQYADYKAASAGLDEFRAEIEKTGKQVWEAKVRQSLEKKDYRITDDNYGVAGQKQRYTDNVAAIRLLKQIESDNRLATADEQDVLARYTGWGAVPQAFGRAANALKDNWANEYHELKALLTPDEYAAARASTLNAHYTSPLVVRSMYAVLENMGFQSGNVLDPACGIGNFFGMLPDSMAGSKVYGVELDSITARIARQLYQNVQVTQSGFENTQFDDNFFDVAIGNVPFGSYKVSDPKYNKHNFLVHDFFFAKTLDKVRPGGIVAFVTSKGTMDKANPEVRRYIAQRAELLGAIRLPNTAFKANAGTEVTADILFLQKRDRPIEIEPDWVHLSQTDDGVQVNAYFAEHPEMVLGRMSYDSTMYGKDTACFPFEDRSLPELLEYAVQNIRGSYEAVEIDEELENAETVSIPADPDVKNFTFAIVDGDIYYRENSVMTKTELNDTAAARVRGMVAIRRQVRDIIDAQMENRPDDQIESMQAGLNELYDDFVKKYGVINSRGNKLAFQNDADYPLLCSLEIMNDENEFVGKAAFFSKRTIKPQLVMEKADSPEDALIVSMAERGRVDVAFMSSLCGMQPDELIAGLQGQVFRDTLVETGDALSGWIPRDEYLSGNVRQKLRLAELKAKTDDRFQINVQELKSVLPEDIEAADIEVRLGSVWIPQDDVKDFIVETLDPPGWAQNRLSVQYSEYSSSWSISNKPYTHGNVLATETYGTKRMNAYEIIEATLNLRSAQVRDKVEIDGKERYVVNSEETMLAQERQEVIKEKFREWVFSDPERRQRLVRKYNDEYNNLRPREYDGSHLRFYGMNPEIELRKHQKDAIARVLYGGNSLLGHVVGAGKTFSITAAVQEAKRMGLCAKAMIVVPNHLVEQWASEYLRLYPAANILVVNKKEFEKKKRRKFCARIATGEYDAVIIGHSQLEKIPMSARWQQEHIEEQINSVMADIARAKEQNAENWTIKQMERTRKSLESRLENLNQIDRDDTINFEELGIDMLVVDESHEFKNMAFTTKMRNVAGISQSDAKKASDLFMKCRYIDKITGARGIVFATGTPISNTLAELYTNQRYLQYDELHARGVSNFDAWASVFAETKTAMELAPSGRGYRLKTRLATYYNLPELCNMIANFADIKTGEDLNLPVPKIKGGKPENVLLPPSKLQRRMVDDLVERSEAIRSRTVDPKSDNMLKVTNDGRSLALDVRIIDPDLPDEDGSKIIACRDNVFRIWQQTQDDKAAQLIFSDLATPTGKGFTVYSDLKKKLMALGVPESEIAYIHEAKTDVQKANLFAKVRSGNVRILMGSTAKMGAGTNIQDRLYALHHLCVPWRPSDLAQREGRIIRPGNMYLEIEIFRYIKEGTFDSYSYQIIEGKQRFISQIMTNKPPSRRMDDIDDSTLNYAEVKALASGNPKIKLKMELDMDIARLQLLKNKHQAQQYRLQDMSAHSLPRSIRNEQEKIERYTEDMQKAQSVEGFSMSLLGETYTDKEQAGKALLDIMKSGAATDEPLKCGKYKHFDLVLEYSVFRKEDPYQLTLVGSKSYTIDLSKSDTGNITRLLNVEKGIDRLIENSRESIVDYEKQIEMAQQELGKAFPQEQELKEKLQEVARLNIELDLNNKEHDVQPEPVEDIRHEPVERIQKPVEQEYEYMER
jgi:N12 class adenine-specific DNA methylase/adenine-specific DNA methylase